MRGTDLRFSSQCQMIAGKTECAEKNRESAARSGEGDRALVKVLLAGDSQQEFSLSRRRLERKGCQCHFARSQRELEQLLKRTEFDIVLTMHRIKGRGAGSLGALLSGSRTTLFYALPVEVGCWWVPVLRIGTDCLGRPPCVRDEFSDVLDELVEEIRATAIANPSPETRLQGSIDSLLSGQTTSREYLHCGQSLWLKADAIVATKDEEHGFLSCSLALAVCVLSRSRGRADNRSGTTNPSSREPAQNSHKPIQMDVTLALVNVTVTDP